MSGSVYECPLCHRWLGSWRLRARHLAIDHGWTGRAHGIKPPLTLREWALLLDRYEARRMT